MVNSKVDPVRIILKSPRIEGQTSQGAAEEAALGDRSSSPPMICSHLLVWQRFRCQTMDKAATGNSWEGWEEVISTRQQEIKWKNRRGWFFLSKLQVSKEVTDDWQEERKWNPHGLFVVT